MRITRLFRGEAMRQTDGVQFNKVFGVGLSKTGTSSLAKALSVVGVPCLHSWDLAQLDKHPAASDVSIALRFRELDVLYPGSKFILTVRDRGAWLDSCRRHWSRHPAPLPDQAPGARFEYMWCRVKLYGRLDFDPENHWRCYTRHVEAVRDYFAGRPEDLLEMNIVAGEGWEKLCPFLGISVPGVRFPWENRDR